MVVRIISEGKKQIPYMVSCKYYILVYFYIALEKWLFSSDVCVVCKQSEWMNDVEIQC